MLNSRLAIFSHRAHLGRKIASGAITSSKRGGADRAEEAITWRAAALKERRISTGVPASSLARQSLAGNEAKTTKHAEPHLDLMADRGIAATGIAAAIGSAAFAAIMVFQGSQWSSEERGRLDPPDLVSTVSLNSSIVKIPFARRESLGQILDYSPTASISPPEREQGARRIEAGTKRPPSLASALARQEQEPYVLCFVHRNMALLKGAKGYRPAKRGTVLPGAGLVLSIERRENEWVVVTDKRIIKLRAEQMLPESAPRSGGRAGPASGFARQG